MNKKLLYVKTIHTIIWVFYNLVFFYIVYAGITNRLDRYFWIAIGLEVLEIAILIIFRGYCPLTLIGRQYTDNPEVGFDIFLPQWLAKNNKLIYGSGLTLVILLILLRAVLSRT